MNTKDFRFRVERMAEFLDKSQPVTMKAKLKVRGREGDVMESNTQAEVEALSVFLQDFAKNVMGPFIAKQMQGAVQTPSPWMPKVVEGREKFNRNAQPRDVSSITQRLYDRYSKGFRDMLSNITATSIEKQKGRVVAHMGPEALVMGQQLKDYSVLRGGGSPTMFNSFFMAAEFGTGIYADKRWFHNDPPSKEADGSWWVQHPTREGFGAHFLGQKPMNFMFGGDGRTPKPVYEEFIKQRLYQALDHFLLEKYPEGNMFRT